MKIATNVVVSLLALGALLGGTASQATNIAELPLKASVLAKPNVVFAMDESGSMDWELMIDGSPSGIMFSWSDNTTCILNSRLMFSANLQSLWEPTGGWTYELECRLRLRDQTDTTRFDSTLGKQLALDPTDDRDLAWRVRKRNAATGNGLLVRGHAAWQPVWRKGT